MFGCTSLSSRIRGSACADLQCDEARTYTVIWTKDELDQFLILLEAPQNMKLDPGWETREEIRFYRQFLRLSSGDSVVLISNFLEITEKSKFLLTIFADKLSGKGVDVFFIQSDGFEGKSPIHVHISLSQYSDLNDQGVEYFVSGKYLGAGRESLKRLIETLDHPKYAAFDIVLSAGTRKPLTFENIGNFEYAELPVEILVELEKFKMACLENGRFFFYTGFWDGLNRSKYSYFYFENVSWDWRIEK